MGTIVIVHSCMAHDPFAPRFGNENDYVISSRPIGIDGAQARTLEFWAILNDKPEHLAGWGATNLTGGTFGAYTYARRLYFYASGGGDFPVSDFTPDGRWHHVAIVYDGSQVLFYLDGALKDRMVRALNTIDGPLCLGVREDIEHNVDHYSGAIDEVRVWNRARTGEEIRADVERDLSGKEDGLVLYYRFDNMRTIRMTPHDTTVVDASSSHNPGRMIHFTFEATVNAHTAEIPRSRLPQDRTGASDATVVASIERPLPATPAMIASPAAHAPILLHGTFGVNTSPTVARTNPR